VGREKAFGLDLYAGETPELLWVGRTNQSFMSSFLCNSQRNDTCAFVACFH